MASHELEEIRLNSADLETHKTRLDLRNAYQVDNLKKARQLYMRDLIAEKIDTVDHKVSLNSLAVKRVIVDEFCKETGLHRNIAYEYFKEASQDSLSLIGVANVQAQTIKLNMAMLEDAYDNVKGALNGSSEKAQALNAYAGILKNVNDALGKLQLVEVNKDRNEVQRERTRAEAAVNMTGIAMQLEGTLEDKRNTLKNALHNSKALRDVVNQLKAKNVSNDDVGVNVNDFKGVVVEE